MRKHTLSMLHSGEENENRFITVAILCTVKQHPLLLFFSLLSVHTKVRCALYYLHYT